MVAFDYSKEPSNPWDKADWNPKAQIDFMRRMRAEHRYDSSGEPRITQRIAQSDTKGIPPKDESKRPPYQVIIQKRFIGSQASTQASVQSVAILNFEQSGILTDSQQFTLGVVPVASTFPGSLPSTARCDVAPTSDALLSLLLGDTLIATILFAANSTTGIIAWISPSTLVEPGDLLYVIAPYPADPTLAGVNIAFLGKAAA